MAEDFENLISEINTSDEIMSKEDNSDQEDEDTDSAEEGSCDDCEN